MRAVAAGGGANVRRKRRRSSRIEHVEKPAPAAPVPASWEWPKDLAKPGGPIPLIDQVQYAVGQLYAVKKPDVWDRQWSALQERLLPRLAAMAESNDMSVALRAAEAAAVLQRCYTDRQEAAVRYGETAMKSFATLEAIKLQTGAAGAKFGGEELAGMIEAILPPLVEAVAEKLRERKVL